MLSIIIQFHERLPPVLQINIKREHAKSKLELCNPNPGSAAPKKLRTPTTDETKTLKCRKAKGGEEVELDAGCKMVDARCAMLDVGKAKN